MIPSDASLSSCDVYRLWPNADSKILGPAMYTAINSGGPKGLDTQSDVFAVEDDPLNVAGCKVCLVKFLDGSPVTVRYQTRDLFRKALIPLEATCI